MEIQFNEKMNKPKSRGGQIKEFILEVVRIVVISIAIIVPIRYYLVQPFYVKGASMEPNFYDREYLLIYELSYYLREPVRGEVIVFRFPLNRKEYFIKRIIGLPGETVKIEDEGIYIYSADRPDGWLLNENEYLTGGLKTLPMANDTLVLSENEYFVMGDNRNLSLDSREFGSVSGDLIVGRTIIRGWPFDRIDTFFETPNYNLNAQTSE